METGYISLADAAKRLNNSYVVCNNIAAIDPTVVDNLPDGMQEEDIYSWYLSDCTQTDARLLSSWFGLAFSFSDLLGMFVLCVDSFGERWDSIIIEDKTRA